MVKTFQFMFEQPRQYHALMRKLTDNTIRYLQQQTRAGVNAIQIFDSWAGILSKEVYQAMVLPYVEDIFESITLPSIYFAKNGAHFFDLLSDLKADILSLDHTVMIGSPELLRHKKGVQGNLYNGLLFADFDIIQKEVHRILEAATRHERFIF